VVSLAWTAGHARKALLEGISVSPGSGSWGKRSPTWVSVLTRSTVGWAWAQPMRMAGT